MSFCLSEQVRGHQNSKLDSWWHLASKQCERKQVMGEQTNTGNCSRKKNNPVVLLLFRKLTQQFIGMKEKRQNKWAYKFISKDQCHFPSNIYVSFLNFCISYIYIHNQSYVCRYMEIRHTFVGNPFPKKPVVNISFFFLEASYFLPVKVFSWIMPQSLFSEFVSDDK